MPNRLEQIREDLKDGWMLGVDTVVNCDDVAYLLNIIDTQRKCVEEMRERFSDLSPSYYGVLENILSAFDRLINEEK